MKGTFCELKFSPKDGHATYLYRLLMDGTLTAVASGTSDYVPITEYLAVDHNGNIQMLKPYEMLKIVDEAIVKEEVGEVVYASFEKLIEKISK